MKQLKNLLHWLGIGKMRELQEENAILKEKLQQRQEVINQTNAYWKRKMHMIKKGKQQL